MQTSIVFRNLEGDESIVTYIERRLAFSFARTEHAIDSIAVTVSDINGPKGGIDKQVQILIKPNGMKEVVVQERRGDMRPAIDRAISRSSQSFMRKLKRRRMLKQKPVSRDYFQTLIGGQPADQLDSASFTNN